MRALCKASMLPPCTSIPVLAVGLGALSLNVLEALVPHLSQLECHFLREALLPTTFLVQATSRESLSCPCHIPNTVLMVCGTRFPSR